MVGSQLGAGQTHGTAAAVGVPQDRTSMWVRAGLRDLYGAEYLEVLYAAFRRFVHDRSIGITGPLRWDEQTGAVRRWHEPDRVVTAIEWAQLADWMAFDQVAAPLLRAHRVLGSAVAQLQRVGEHAEVDVSDPTSPVLTLTPEALLRVLQPQIRGRWATPGWDAADATAAAILTGVAGQNPTAPRDQAILDALHRGEDPWVTALRWDNPAASSEGALDDMPIADHPRPQPASPVARLALAAIAAGIVTGAGPGSAAPAEASRSGLVSTAAPAPSSVAFAEQARTERDTVLQRDSNGAGVQELQRVLNAWYPGLTPLVEDGIYGPRTEARVAVLQHRAHLVVDGMAGPHTLAALGLEDVVAVTAGQEDPGAVGSGVDGPAPDSAAPPAAAAVVLPASGELTSGFGDRWGSTHYGIDIANEIGTPIVSTSDGVVVESGPATGFGLWVRVEHDDGTVSVYGHINESLVYAGQRVSVGEQIATMGNRGQTTGPHLHFEIWRGGGEKIDPADWLRDYGVAP